MKIIKGKEVYGDIYEIINPKHTAVLVIDMQNDLCQPNGYFGKRGCDIFITRGTVTPLAKFLEEVRCLSVKVIYRFSKPHPKMPQEIHLPGCVSKK